MPPSLDLGPVWKVLSAWLDFVQGRLEYGQTDAEGQKMHSYVSDVFNTLRRSVLQADLIAEEHPSRALFWNDCLQKLEMIIDTKVKHPRGSVSFEVLYTCLVEIQSLVFFQSNTCWISGKRPSAGYSRKMPKSKRQKTGPGMDWVCPAPGCKRWNYSSASVCPSCGQARPSIACGSMGEGDIWLWRNPPTILYEGDGFWIFHKHAYWVVQTPERVEELLTFCPKNADQDQRVDGSFTTWVYRKYAAQYPFLNKYDVSRGINYGVLNRLDRETSGPVIVAKDEKTYWKLRSKRDNHYWHKEYTCLIHGNVPVDHWQGVLDDWMITETRGFSGRSMIAEPHQHGASKATSLYRVMGYYKRQANGKTHRYTLVRVRIITGRRHQIRVHMHHFMKQLGSQLIGTGEDFGLVSDFQYLKRTTVNEDKANICERVFLHETMIGMWDPENYHKLVWVKAELPDELKLCLARLEKDEIATAKLVKHKTKLRKSGVDDFCQRYNLGPRERAELKEGNYWKENRPTLKKLMKAFQQRAGSGLTTLSMDGDHSFLFEGIRKELEQCGTTTQEDRIEDVLKKHIDDTLWWQKQDLLEAQASEAKPGEVLPAGWRRMEVEDEVFYLHTDGVRARTAPICDESLPLGFSKFQCESRTGKFYFLEHATGKNIWIHPNQEEFLPAGWEKHKSTTSGREYYLHVGTGKAQFGFPCEGPVEDLPLGWEKCFSRSKGEPYYFHPSSRTSQFERPGESLPPGWVQRTSRSSGTTYYSHAETGKTQIGIPCEGSLEELPRGWEKCVSKAGGKPYYWHPKTGKKQTGIPCEGSLEELPPGWQKCAPRGGGQPYYFNSEAKQSQYERPSLPWDAMPRTPPSMATRPSSPRNAMPRTPPSMATRPSSPPPRNAIPRTPPSLAN